MFALSQFDRSLLKWPLELLKPGQNVQKHIGMWCGPLWSAVVHCGPLWCGAMINLLIRGSLQTGRQLGFKLGSNQLIRLPSMLCCSPMVLNSWQPPAVSQLRCPPPHLLHYRWTLERICLVQLVSKIISPLCNLSTCKTSVWTQWLM